MADYINDETQIAADSSILPLATVKSQENDPIDNGVELIEPGATEREVTSAEAEPIGLQPSAHLSSRAVAAPGLVLEHCQKLKILRHFPVFSSF